MKKYLIPIIAILAALSIAVLVAAQGTNAPVVRELLIPTSTSTNLNAHQLRITVQDCVLDSVTFVPLVTLSLEVWNTSNVPPVIVGKFTHAFTAVQMKALYNSANPQNFLETAALGKVGLNRKP